MIREDTSVTPGYKVLTLGDKAAKSQPTNRFFINVGLERRASDFPSGSKNPSVI